jgi:hypothetical protein
MLRRRVLGVVLTISIACLAVYWSCARLLDMMWISERPSKSADFAPVVADLMTGRLRPDRRGIVVLPGRYSSLTRGGWAYYLRKPNGLVLILFPTWRARGADLKGYLYHNNPLSEADFFWKNEHHWVVAAPQVPAMHRVTIDREVGSHWYYVHLLEHG